MTDKQIRQAVEAKRVVIENFDTKYLQPASYDMRLGEEAITATLREKINPAQKGLLTIPSGDFALVTTHERIVMPPDMAGHLGMRSHYAKKGLVLLSGPQIDPGFKGVLVLGFSNLSPRDIIIPYKDSLCTVEFYSLEQPAEKGYQGEYQEQVGISARDLENLVEAQGMTFGQVIKTLGELSLNVKELTLNVKSLSDSVSFMRWFVPVGLAGTALIITVAIAIINILTRR
ncbi:MAG: dCTP deaminase [Chloroflexi bacterium]|nr:dCTP deaminase [Chloroflexota bacterium]